MPSDSTDVAELRRGGWRYQPVYRDDDAGRAMTLCEVYFDEHGKLRTWTENPAIHPQGETFEDLSRDLCCMLADAYKWKPVAFNALRIGMTFERTGADVERMVAAVDAARRVQ